MAYRTRTTIGLEVTHSQVKLVEIVSSAQGMKITNYAIFNSPPDIKNRAETAELIKDAFGRTTLHTGEIYGVLSSPLVEHRIILVPPMNDQELNMVIRREVSNVRHGESALGMSGETALRHASFGFDEVGQVRTGDIKKTAVLIVTAPNEVIKEQVRAMETQGISPRGLTTAPIALYNALLQSRGCNEEETIALINVGIKSACIIMVSNNTLLFTREFSLTSDTDVTVENYSERITVEVKRSFLYFKQRYRGKVVNRGILSGDLHSPATTRQIDLGTLAGLLSKALDIGVEVFNITDGLEVSLPKENMSEFRHILPSCAVPIGLAIAGLRQSRVNLLSSAGIRKKGTWRADAIFKVVSGVLLLILFGSYLWTSVSNFYTRRTRLHSLNALESLRPELEKINLFKEERHEHAARGRLIESLNKPRLPAAGWSELLREISWLVPDDIVFNSLEARPETNLGLSITIEVNASSRGRVNEFLSHLKNSTSLSFVSSRQEISPSPSQRTAEGLHFAIELEVR